MYGSFIMNKKETKIRKGIDDLPTIPIILSEWTDMKPENVHRMHNTDWFAIQKELRKVMPKLLEQGHFKTKVTNEWKRMTAMDVSDVYYNIINGKEK
jgi:hypothetical protein